MSGLLSGRLERRLLVILIVLMTLASGTALAERLVLRAKLRDPARPSIVLILTDDQRWDTLWAMPNVRRLLGAHGVTFTNAFVNNSVCCPSRASILTGQYSGTTGVWGNRPPHGGFSAFDDRVTIATQLQKAGYRTAQIGKYLNGYYGDYVPPGWDRWFAFSQTVPYQQLDLYEDYWINDDGKLRFYGDDRGDYSTDVLAEEAVRFIQDTREPLFLHFSVVAPHNPATPHPDDVDAFSDLPPHDPPNYDEADVSDKPEWVRRLPTVDKPFFPLTPPPQELRLLHLRTLPSVDRAVARIVDALRDTGRLENTLILFMSDNGFSWGEHRWVNKQNPYEENIRIPMVMRYDRLIEEPRRDDRFVLNIDVAPTFATLVGMPLPGADGEALLPLLDRPYLPGREDFLLEHRNDEGPRIPPYCGLRNHRFTYVRYANSALEEELYDLREDRWQLQNVARHPRYQRTLEQLRDRLRALCSTPPPGSPVGFPP